MPNLSGLAEQQREWFRIKSRKIDLAVISTIDEMDDKIDQNPQAGGTIDEREWSLRELANAGDQMIPVLFVYEINHGVAFIKINWAFFNGSWHPTKKELGDI